MTNKVPSAHNNNLNNNTNTNNNARFKVTVGQLLELLGKLLQEALNSLDKRVCREFVSLHRTCSRQTASHDISTTIKDARVMHTHTHTHAHARTRTGDAISARNPSLL